MILPFGCVPDTLSTHFGLQELIKTSKTQFNNTPPNYTVVANLREVCNTVLEKARTHFKAEVIVNSGYRSKEVNQKVGGSASSEDCYGRAVDFTVKGVTCYEVALWVRDNIPQIGELILEEFVADTPTSGWVHYSLPHVKKNWIKTKFLGSKVYHDGIILNTNSKGKSR